MRAFREAPADEPLFERHGASGARIDFSWIQALAQLLPQLSHLPFQAFDAIEHIVEARGIHRLQEGPDGRDGTSKFSLLWDRMVRCVCHQRLLRRWWRGWPYAADVSNSELRPTSIDRQFGAGREGR